MDGVLIGFKSGHIKSFKGVWDGSNAWVSFTKEDGGIVSANKLEVEFVETLPEHPASPDVSGVMAQPEEDDD